MIDLLGCRQRKAELRAGRKSEIQGNADTQAPHHANARYRSNRRRVSAGSRTCVSSLAGDGEYTIAAEITEVSCNGLRYRFPFDLVATLRFGSFGGVC